MKLAIIKTPFDKMELRPGSCNERNQKEDIRMDDVRSLAQGKYHWGIIKNRKLNSKFVKCSKGGVPKQNASYFYDCKEI